MVRVGIHGDRITSTALDALPSSGMTAFEAVLDQALKLPDVERSKLAARLLNSLELDDGDELSAEEWDAAWSAELGKRVREICGGTVELVDGDEVLAELREIAGRP